MNKKIIFISILVISMALLSFGEPQLGRNRQYAQNRTHTFDVNNPVEISGTIAKVETVTAGKGRYGTGVHLTINSGGNESLVHMGPAAYLDSNQWKLAKGENVSVKVFKGTGNNSGQLFAAQITRGKNQLAMRDDAGRAMWRQSLSGQRRGGRGMGRQGRRGGGRNFSN